MYQAQCAQYVLHMHPAFSAKVSFFVWETHRNLLCPCLVGLILPASEAWPHFKHLKTILKPFVQGISAAPFIPFNISWAMIAMGVLIVLRLQWLHIISRPVWSIAPYSQHIAPLVARLWLRTLGVPWSMVTLRSSGCAMALCWLENSCWEVDGLFNICLIFAWYLFHAWSSWYLFDIRWYLILLDFVHYLNICLTACRKGLPPSLRGTAARWKARRKSCIML